jgi:hypothetical protein
MDGQSDRLQSARRVAFSFAMLQGGRAGAKVETPAVVVQSAPRASFSPFYLKPALPGRNGGEHDYSAERTPRLAGRKRYLPREPGPDPLGRLQKIRLRGVASSDITSKLRFLIPADSRKPLVFRGTIRLHNVTASEIGAVLFALTHGGDPQKPYRHMMGRAKPFGAGQMRLRSLVLTADANLGTPAAAPEQDEYLSDDTRTGFSPRGRNAASLKPFLKAFGDFMRRQPGLKGFPNSPVILEFLAASDPQVGAEIDQELTYLPLPSFNAIRGALKPLKDGSDPATLGAPDGRLLAAPAPKRKPVFWA